MTTAEAAGGSGSSRRREAAKRQQGVGGRQQIQRRQQEAAQPRMGNASDDAAAEDLSVLSLSLSSSLLAPVLLQTCVLAIQDGTPNNYHGTNLYMMSLAINRKMMI